MRPPCLDAPLTSAALFSLSCNSPPPSIRAESTLAFLIHFNISDSARGMSIIYQLSVSPAIVRVKRAEQQRMEGNLLCTSGSREQVGPILHHNYGTPGGDAEDCDSHMVLEGGCQTFAIGCQAWFPMEYVTRKPCCLPAPVSSPLRWR